MFSNLLLSFDKHLNKTPMKNFKSFGPTYGPITKQGAKHMYAFYSAEAVIGSIDWPTAKKMMDFYKMYL